LNAQRAVTLANYYKSFVSISGALAAAFGVGPLLSEWLPTSISAYLFPPLGDMTSAARFGVCLLAIVLTYIVFYANTTSPHRFRQLLVAVIVSFLSLCCYLVLYSLYVRSIDVPAAKSVIHVSIGYERTGFAQHTFGSDSDLDMLKARGTDDDQISKLWTLRSLTIARLSLFVALCAFVLPLVWVFSLGVRYQM
jgi:hypothetical protein